MSVTNKNVDSGVGAPRRVCVVLVDRANYGRLQPVMAEIARRPELELQVIASGSMVLERFDEPVRVVEDDGFRVDARIFLELEGSNPITMAKSVGFGIVEYASEFQRLEPDMVLLIGDRYEAVAAAVAAAYMNLTLVHIQGGEVSGSIDESARHVITKLSHYHFPATERAKEYIIRMGERPETVLGVGCPASDLARKLNIGFSPELINDRGSGIRIDPDAPFLLSVFHPTTTEYGGEREQMSELIKALLLVGVQTVLLWPNIDAGSNHISKVIRERRNNAGENWCIRTITNLKPDDYQRVLAKSSCAVGNSSSFVRDASFFWDTSCACGPPTEIP